MSKINETVALKMADEFLSDARYFMKDMYSDGQFKTFDMGEGKEVDLGYSIEGDDIGVTCRLVINSDTIEVYSSDGTEKEDILKCIFEINV